MTPKGPRVGTIITGSLVIIEGKDRGSIFPQAPTVHHGGFALRERGTVFLLSDLNTGNEQRVYVPWEWTNAYAQVSNDRSPSIEAALLVAFQTGLITFAQLPDGAIGTPAEHVVPWAVEPTVPAEVFSAAITTILAATT